MNGTGFAFIEVLSECPLYLGLEPEAAEEWVRDVMTKTYSPGNHEGRHGGGPRSRTSPRRPSTLSSCWTRSDATELAPDRFADGFPTALDPDDVSLKLAGAGGDGAQTAAMVITRAAINEGFDSTHIPSYGPESRGGTSYADVHVALT